MAERRGKLGFSMLVGREREVLALDEAIAAAGAGRSVVVMLSGEPGIGKTRLLDELATRASRAARSDLDARYRARTAAYLEASMASDTKQGHIASLTAAGSAAAAADYLRCRDRERDQHPRPSRPRL